jgi:uracil-DNA glycosylase
VNNLGPPIPPAGPTRARIAIVADFPTEAESEKAVPSVGPTYYQLRAILRTIGASLDDCYRTHVFTRRPDRGNLALYATTSPSPTTRNLTPLVNNPIAFVDDCWLPELDRLRDELTRVDPNVVIAIGDAATWALLGQQGINGLRGSTHVSHFLPHRQLKVVPTYHPSILFRGQWDQRVVIAADLEKAHGESSSREFSYDNTELWLAPTLDDIREFGSLYLDGASEVATDVETKRGQITCLSFAPTPERALVIPFWQDGPQSSYWSTIEDEIEAWMLVAKWIESPRIIKVMQNGLYDIQYFMRHGMTPRACTEDTMLAHHSLWSELKKGLGFLGSIHANVPSWKSMRTYKLEEVTKRDD